MQSHAQRLAAREAADRAAIYDRLQGLLNRVPGGYPTWSIQQVRAYKDATEKAISLMSKPHAALRSLRDIENTLNTFYTGK